MTKKYAYQEAKDLIHKIHEAADTGEFSSREAFMDMLERNPHIAAQGYNPFGKIFFWNSASTHLYGHREDEVINQDLVELLLPPEMRQFARDVIMGARKTGQMPDPGSYDLMTSDGGFVTVYSGHLVFQWDNATTPEFYCVDLALDTDSVEAPAPTAL